MNLQFRFKLGLVFILFFILSCAQAQTPNLWDSIRPELKMTQYNQHPKVRYFIHYYQQRPKIVYSIFHHGQYYLYNIVQEVRRQKLPMELALIPFVESGFKASNTSSAAAQGIWQIRIPAGERFGINTRDPWVNGLRDIYQSTQAALKYFRKLYDYFDQNWLYAIAAYNVGEGRFKKAIQANLDQKLSTHYFDLNLPQQTQNYVPKLLAIAEIVRNPRKYHIDLPDIPNQPLTGTIALHRQMSLDLIAQLARLDEDLILLLNPGLKYLVTPPAHTYPLVLPLYNAKLFLQNYTRFPERQITSWKLYTVKPGDRLKDIAYKLKTTAGILIHYNRLEGKKLMVGQGLVYPSRSP